MASENEPDFAGGWPECVDLCEQREERERDLGGGWEAGCCGLSPASPRLASSGGQRQRYEAGRAPVSGHWSGRDHRGDQSRVRG